MVVIYVGRTKISTRVYHSTKAVTVLSKPEVTHILSCLKVLMKQNALWFRSFACRNWAVTLSCN
jgi:hypothetical protein